MSNFLKRFVRDERGVSAMEYAILAGIIVVALAAVGSTMSSTFTTLFTGLFNRVEAAAGGG
jgi:pilus assembly protein Flp/PilA